MQDFNIVSAIIKSEMPKVGTRNTSDLIAVEQGCKTIYALLRTINLQVVVRVNQNTNGPHHLCEEASHLLVCFRKRVAQPHNVVAIWLPAPYEK